MPTNRKPRHTPTVPNPVEEARRALQTSIDTRQ
jgi:hypothetical protein